MTEPPDSGSAEVLRDVGTVASEALRPGEAPPPVDLARVIRRIGRLPSVKRPTAYVLHAALGEDAAARGMAAFRAIGVRVPVGAKHFAIVGRHHAADVRLAADPTIALRHLLVRAVATVGGMDGVRGGRGRGAPRELRVHIELRGLGDGRGAIVVPGGEERGVHVARAAVVAVGGYALIALPVDDGAEADAAAADHLPLARREHFSSEFADLGGIYPGPLTASHIEAIRTGEGEACGRIVLTRGEEEVRICVSAAELHSGVLVGRYADRCLWGRGAALLDGTISRTHALLIGHRAGPSIYDLASLNGLHQRGQRVRMAYLGGGQHVHLAGADGVKLEWR